MSKVYSYISVPHPDKLTGADWLSLDLEEATCTSLGRFLHSLLLMLPVQRSVMVVVLPTLSLYHVIADAAAGGLSK